MALSVFINSIYWNEPGETNIEYTCDSCYDELNLQEDFSCHESNWECKACGHVNYIEYPFEYDLNKYLPDWAEVILTCSDDALEDEIKTYLEETYNHEVDYFEFSFIDLDEDNQTITDDDLESNFDDDFELANFSNGFSLTED